MTPLLLAGLRLALGILAFAKAWAIREKTHAKLKLPPSFDGVSEDVARALAQPGRIEDLSDGLSEDAERALNAAR
jgi:hypothetical protein